MELTFSIGMHRSRSCENDVNNVVSAKIDSVKEFYPLRVFPTGSYFGVVFTLNKHKVSNSCIVTTNLVETNTGKDITQAVAPSSSLTTTTATPTE